MLLAVHCAVGHDMGADGPWLAFQNMEHAGLADRATSDSCAGWFAGRGLQRAVACASRARCWFRGCGCLFFLPVLYYSTYKQVIGGSLAADVAVWRRSR